MFKTVKLKLTAWYLVIIMAVTVSFSAVIYEGVSRITEAALANQRARIERRMKEFGIMPHVPRSSPLFDEDALEEIKHETLERLILINLFVFTLSAVLGYFLSGRTLAPIEEMITKQKRFISDAAHDLKTPLTAMKTDLEVTLRDKNFNKEKGIVAIKEAIAEIDKLNRFISGLLSKSRYQNGTLKTAPVNLKEVLSASALKLKPLAEKKAQKVELSVEDSWIVGNVASLSELFVNLIDNAIKYGDNNSTITIKARSGRDEIRVSITDYGAKIPEDDLLKIFEPFYRADSSRSKGLYDGFGLGLSIVKDIVDSHKGHISVVSEKERGTTFTVSFPKVHGV